MTDVYRNAFPATSSVSGGGGGGTGGSDDAFYASGPDTFDIPVSLPDRSIAITQTGQAIRMTSETDTFIAGCKFVFSYEGCVVRTLTIGDGIVRDGDGFGIDVTLNGTDFISYAGKTLLCEATLFNVGDRDAVFNLVVRGSNV